MKPRVRVLVVTDDGGSNGGFLRWQDQPAADARGPNARPFHLGEFMECLTSTSWVGFDLEVTRAHRTTPAEVGLTEAALKADRGADVVGFRFNQPHTVNGVSRSLGDYDAILFFAVRAGDPDATLAPEADAIAAFMEAGGGFFATGDHANLGAPLCGLIPRVRSMRRWWVSPPPGTPPAPPPLTADRVDTTRSGADAVTNFEDQSDEFGQPISPTWYAAGFGVKGGYPARRALPHPLLCSPLGAVSWLPDHMHEGMCEVPSSLGGTFGAAGLREYPDYAPSGGTPSPLAPEIVARGTVLAGVTSPALDTLDHVGATTPATGKTVGVICAWDGHRVGKGRVVVDSTWHHFFDINLSGDRFLEGMSLGPGDEQKRHGFYVPDGMGGRKRADTYEQIRWYYRNIVYWLIPANRWATLWWDGLIQVVMYHRIGEELAGVDLRNPRAILFDHLHYFGQLAEQYFASVRGACATYLIHKYIYRAKIPWWEWVEKVVDIWDPARAESPRETGPSEEWLGAVGLAPRVDLPATIGLGAAVLAAAQVLRMTQRNGDVGRAIEEVWPPMLEHAARVYGEALKHGVGQGKRLATMLEKGSAAPASR